MSKFDEQILVVARETILPEPFNGYKPISEYSHILSDALNKIEVKRRGDMEEDPTYKQLISYVVVKNDKNETLLYTRLTGGGEERLHGLSSVGVGGHMNDVEGLRAGDLLLENAKRELLEEIGVEPSQLGLIGVINDDSNEVGQVHIGLVYLAYIGDNPITITETDTLEVQFVNSFEGVAFETWSQILKDHDIV